jgi:hypothetical protein
MRKKKLRGRSLKRKQRKIPVLLLLILLLAGGAGAWQFSEDCRISGVVTYFGDSNLSGLEVAAFVGENKIAFCKTQNGRYELTIPQDDPDTQVKDGWVYEDFITIKVENVPVARFEATSGIKIINLNVSTSDVDNLTTWGKIKALFR